MADLGYNVRSQVGIDGGYYFSKDVESIRTGKVYVCEEGYQSAWGMIEFRDYMRCYKDEAQKYTELKERLAKANTGNGRIFGGLKKTL